MPMQDAAGPGWKCLCEIVDLVAAQASHINDIMNVTQPLLLLLLSTSSFLFLGLVQGQHGQQTGLTIGEACKRWQLQVII